MGLSPETRIMYADDVLQLVALHDVFVYRWTGPGDAKRMEVLLDLHIPYLKALAPLKSVSIAHIATDSVRFPDSRTRELVETHVKAIDPFIAASAIVLTSNALAASIVRAVLSAATLVRRSKYPHKVFSSVDDAMPWLAEQRSQPSKQLSNGAALRAWYRDLERELDTV